MTFPTAHSQIYRNDAGEVTGWDSPGYDDEPYDPEDYLDGADYDDDDDDDEPENHLPIDPVTGRESTGADEIETVSEADEVSWQEYGRAEAYADGLHEAGYGE
jgi:hypothetical protein